MFLGEVQERLEEMFKSSKESQEFVQCETYRGVGCLGRVVRWGARDEICIFFVS